jgi:hypothetical protein
MRKQHCTLTFATSKWSKIFLWPNLMQVGHTQRWAKARYAAQRWYPCIFLCVRKWLNLFLLLFALWWSGMSPLIFFMTVIANFFFMQGGVSDFLFTFQLLPPTELSMQATKVSMQLIPMQSCMFLWWMHTFFFWLFFHLKIFMHPKRKNMFQCLHKFLLLEQLWLDNMTRMCWLD